MAVWGAFAFPIVLAGLVMFGLPIRLLSNDGGRHWWAAVPVILWSGISSQMAWLALTAAFTGQHRLDWENPGLAFGIPAGLAYWLLASRQPEPEVQIKT